MWALLLLLLLLFFILVRLQRNRREAGVQVDRCDELIMDSLQYPCRGADKPQLAKAKKHPTVRTTAVTLKKEPPGPKYIEIKPMDTYSIFCFFLGSLVEKTHVEILHPNASPERPALAPPAPGHDEAVDRHGSRFSIH